MKTARGSDAIAGRLARGLQTRSGRTGSVLVLAVSLAVLAHLSLRYYLHAKTAFFDDTFIYLHVARNAVEQGTFQYFPIVDRGALLASSPLKLLVSSLATLLSSLVGFGERTLDGARVTLAMGSLLTYLLFLPFWLPRRWRQYLLAGCLYFFLAACLDTVFEFEGGLLLLWVATSAMAVLAQPLERTRLAIVLPLGVFIRPDVSGLIYVALLLHLWGRKELNRSDWLRFGIGALAPAVLWTGIAVAMRVHPIPVTYWAKAALPLLFDDQYLLQVLWERLGVSLASNWGFARGTLKLLGYLALGLALAVALAGSRLNRIAVPVVAVLAGFLFSRLPANFWWYYQNLVVVLVAYFYSIVAFGTPTRQRILAGFSLAALSGLLVGQFAVSPQLPWDFGRPTRAQGYEFLAQHATGNGSYRLPELGEVLVKNPEIGIVAYFTGRGAWLWDSGGLAQPAIDRGILESRLRLFYPRRLWEGPEADAARVARNSALPVYEVWAMEDRDFARARTKCQVVIEEGALCANKAR